MTVHTIAKTSCWCLNCPSGIRPGDPVVVDPAYARPGDGNRQPMVHARCDGLPPYDPDREVG